MFFANENHPAHICSSGGGLGGLGGWVSRPILTHKRLLNQETAGEQNHGHATIKVVPHR